MVQVHVQENLDTVEKRWPYGNIKPREIIITLDVNRRKDLKGLTRAGRLAYFRAKRERWTDEEKEAWKLNWISRKTANWKRKRGIDEEPPRKKLRARKSQDLPIQDDAGVQLVHR